MEVASSFFVNFSRPFPLSMPTRSRTSQGKSMSLSDAVNGTTFTSCHDLYCYCHLYFSSNRLIQETLWSVATKCSYVDIYHMLTNGSPSKGKVSSKTAF